MGAPMGGGVNPGTGVYTTDVPSETSGTDSGALCPGCDVVLITVCSLRKDYLGAFGYPSDISPSVDALAKRQKEVASQVGLPDGLLLNGRS